jgi:hypothetical protein
MSAEAYLEYLRGECRRIRRGDAVAKFRGSCDAWTIDPQQVDPLGPLISGRSGGIVWAGDVWSGVATDLLSAVRRAAEGEELPMVLAEYGCFVHLELAAREEPPMGVRAEAWVLPLVVAGASNASATAFRRYAIGWRARAAGLSWNEPEMAYAAALAVSLGSAGDGVIGSEVRLARARLEGEAQVGGVRFRDAVSAGQRDLWRKAAAFSCVDAEVWARQRLI